MLRLAVLLLLLANAAYFAWAQRLLAPWGIAPVQQAEPQRLEQQIKPQAIRVLSTDEARRLDVSAASRPAECLQAGPLDEAQAAALKPVLESWPGGAWSLEAMVEPARWIVYMGKFPNAEAANRKRSELRQMGLTPDALADAALEPGLSLGAFATEAEAARQLEALGRQGVRTAKVVQDRAESRGQLLKLPAVDDALRGRIDELKPALGSRSLRPCR